MAAPGSSERRRGNSEAIYQLGESWYQGWYFDLRLEEEMIRCQRYGYPVSLLVIRVLEELGPPTSDRHREFDEVLIGLAQRRLRRPDLPAILNDHELAICLPHTDRAGAGIVAERIARSLRRFPVAIGVATAGQDARTPGALYARAAEMAGGDLLRRRSA